ncbi:MAG: hypothetical protein ACT4N2_03745 [Hyphomicrobium sp.]
MSALVLALVASLAQTAFGASLFTALDGAWTGGGQVRLDSGKSERIKCKGYYNAKSGGAQLGVAIDCANAAIRINMRANLVDAGGSISGTWEEREFNQSGAVSGKSNGDKLSLNFAGAITGKMSIEAADGQQSVSITTGGPGFVGVDLKFSKR